MRVRKLLAWVAGGMLAAGATLFGGLQTTVGLQWLAQTVSSLASTPDSKIEISDLSGFFPTDLAAGHIALSDQNGPWLRVEGAQVRWSFTSLFSGRLHIDTVSAREVDLLRAPEPARAAPSPPAKSSSFEPPIDIDLRALSIDRLHLAAPIGGVDSVWRVDGEGLIARDGRASDLRLALARTDGPDGKLTVNIKYDPARRAVASEIAFDERSHGLAAALLGQPDLAPVSIHLTVNGNAADGTGKLTVSAGDAATSNGTATWHSASGVTGISVNLTAAAPGLPGSPLARVLRAPLTLVGEASVTDTGVTLRQATLNAGPGRLTAAGQYDFAGEKISGTAALESDDSGALSDLLGGATWRGLRLQLNADGSLNASHIKGHLTASSAELPAQVKMGAVDFSVDATIAELATHPNGPISLNGSVNDLTLTTLGARAPPAARLTVAARAALQRDGRINIETFDATTPVMSVKADGNFATAALEGEGKASITVPDFAAFSGIAGLPLGGRGHLDLTVQPQAGGIKATWQGALEDLSVPDAPPTLLRPTITLSGAATAGRDLAWSLDSVRVASEALTLEIGGRGKSSTGEIDLSLALPKLGAFDADVTGTAALKGKVTLRDDGADVRITTDFNDVVHRGVRSQKLSLVLEAVLRGSAVSGQMQADGDLAGQPLKLAGRFARDAEGGISVPTFEGHWASAAIDIANLAITKTSTTGSGHISMTRLQDLAAVTGADLGGSINLDVTTDQEAAGTVHGKLRGQGLRSGGIGITTLEADTTVNDPLGVAATKATATLSGLSGIADIGRLTATMNGDRQALDVTLQAAGARTNGALTARIEPPGSEVRIALSRFNGRYGEIPVALAATARARVSGARVAIDPASFQLGGGRVTLSGVVDPAASDLVIDIAGMPLAIIEAFAPGSGVSGTLQAKLHLRGPLAAPLIDATYNASGIKMRRPETMFLPPLAVTGTAAVAGRQASIDAKLSAGTSSSLSVKGKGTLPQGRAPLSGSTSITGAIDLAPFAPITGPTVQGVTGRLQADLNFTVSGETITGSGTLNLAGAALNLPKTGLRLDHGEASLALHGNSLQIQRLRFQTAGNGEVTASGSLSLDAAQGFPTDLRVETRRALLVSRTDLIATVSSTLRLTGSTRDGLDLSGPVTIDKAEIAIGAPQVVDYPTVPVREINVPGVPNQVAPPPAAPPQPTAAASSSSLPIKLNVSVDAPRAIFVRGRGLDAEVGGQFRVTGDVAKPIVLGSLSLRRGDFTLAGRRLSFTRGNVSLVTVDTLDPLLDFLATIQAGSTTINLAITGTPRAPKIELTSTPTLPPDEAMALLLFGKVGSALSPFELLQAAQALAELTGVAPGSSLLSKLRSGLGLDRLSINSSGNSSSLGPASSSVEAGRYVSPGVYVGTKQGASPGSSRGTVEIDVFPHVKLNGDVGADSNGRIGAKMEWDY